ncbi:MAG: hypothetical protein IPN17_28275 [Deltaproteobacteria bacterium]|nr:hypothetical protein [Deltaproteobacteria bacterium]MBP6829478.1 hypothetical protein [Deltaproteobacteria bacterium]
MSGRVTVQDHGAKAMLQRARELSGGRKVRVGVLGDAPKREEPVSQRGKHSPKARTRAKVARRTTEAAVGGREKYSLLQVAIVHEFGGGHVPARSFIRATIDEKKAEIQAEQEKALRAVLAGTVTAEVALKRLGAFVVGLMQARIVAGIAPPLAASTLRRKGGKTTPLILTGQLRSGLTYAVEGT